MKNLAVEISKEIGKGVAGGAAGFGGVYVSILPKLEAWLRVTSLLLGIVVAGLTVVSISLTIRRKMNGSD